MHEIFEEWNTGELDSYLIEITRDILAYKDTDGTPLVDKILDTAGQKGTGKWTVQSSADLGIPITLIAEAVYSRCVSALKDDRVKAAKKLKGPKPLMSVAKNDVKKKQFITEIRDALYASKIISYAQGYMLMRAAAAEHKWNLNYGGIALMWRGGCIIRSRFLGKIKEAFDTNPKLTNLLLDNYFRGEIKRCQKSWRNVVAAAAKKGIPVPAFGTALAFYDQYRNAVLPANLLQAQRDYFGAHTYERVDKPRGEFFHTNWTGRGGTTASSTLQRLMPIRQWTLSPQKSVGRKNSAGHAVSRGSTPHGPGWRWWRWRSWSWRRFPGANGRTCSLTSDCNSTCRGGFARARCCTGICIIWRAGRCPSISTRCCSKSSAFRSAR